MNENYESFDPKKAMERNGGGEERFLEVAEFFPSYVAQLLTDVDEAWTQEDRATLKKNSHKLKGSLGMVGAESAFALATKIEKLAIEADRDTMERLLGELKSTITSLTSELKAYVKNQKDS